MTRCTNVYVYDKEADTERGVDASVACRQNQYVLYNIVYFGAVADMQIYVKLHVCVGVQPAWPRRRTLHKRQPSAQQAYRALTLPPKKLKKPHPP